MRLSYLALTFISRVVNSMLDSVYFPEETHTKSARIVLETSEKETERACQVACGENAMCMAISYVDPACILLGEESAEMTCNAAVKVPTKSDVKTDRTNMTAEMGKDPCVEEFFPAETSLNRGGVCLKDDRYLVIRGINESGSRVTFDTIMFYTLTFDTTRNMWKLEFTQTGVKQWLVAVCCAITNDACPCSSLPLLDAKWGIQNGVPAQINVIGACEDKAHVFSYWNPNFGDDIQPKEWTLSVEDTNTYKVKCHAGIWLISQPGTPEVGGQVSNGTCAPPRKVRKNITEEMGTDSCVEKLFPDETALNKVGVCPRNDRGLVIRGVDENGVRLTFGNDVNFYFLTFDDARNMWMLELKSTGVKTWLVAVSCATTNNECPCKPLMMLDAKWGINGVSAQPEATGACEDKSHVFSLWAANYGEDLQPEPLHIQSEEASTYVITCHAGIWVYSVPGIPAMGGQLSNATCSPPALLLPNRILITFATESLLSSTNSY